VCSHHHHQIHDLGWHLAVDGERTVTIRAPDGRIVERQAFTPAGRAPTGWAPEPALRE
jgi:hypothetical protein